MRISGLGVIDDAVLELAPGLTAVTGETGAGKTMVVTGLGLLFGGRADPGAVRLGPRPRSVEGRLRVEPDGAVAARAEEAGAELDDGALLLARTVSARAGPGRTWAVGPCRRACSPSWPTPGRRARPDRPVAAAAAGPPARGARPLRGRGGHRAARHVPAAYAGCGRSPPSWPSSTTRARERAQEADLLRFGLDEIEAADPQPGEDAALRSRRSGWATPTRCAAAPRWPTTRCSGSPRPPDEGRDATALVAAAQSALEQVGVARPGAGRARRPAEGDRLPAGRRGRRARVLRRRRSTPTRRGWRPSRSGGPR